MRIKPTITPRIQPRMIGFSAVFLAFAGYLYLFLLQPSIIGFQDDQGKTLNRLTDLVVMPGLVSGIFGEPGQSVYMWDRIPILLRCILWLALGGCIGWPIIRSAVPTHAADERLERATQIQIAGLAMLAGLAILSTLTLGVGWAGWLGRRWPLAGLVGGLAVAASWWSYRHGFFPSAQASHQQLENQRRDKSGKNSRESDVASRRRTKSTKRLKSGRTQAEGAVESPSRDQATKATHDPLAPETVVDMWLSRLVPVLTIVLAACYLLGSMLPAWEFDVLEYHLQAPKEFQAAERIRYLDHNVYANMPLGAEMHSLAAMTLIGGERGWWWGGLLGKTITGCFSLLAAGLLWSFLRMRVSSGTAWCATGLFLATGGNVHVSLSGLIDMVLGAYLLGALILIFVIWPDLAAGKGRLSQVFALGLMAGGAAACKYPGFLLVPVPCGVALLLAIYWHQSARQAALHLLVFGLALGLTCAPWLAKNAIQIGNPIYPLAYEYFGGGGLSERGVEAWQRVHSPQAVEGRAPFSIAAAWHSVRQLTIDSPFLNPSLVFLSLSGLVVFPRSRNHVNWLLPALSFMLWSLSIWWLATHRIDRFWLPILPVAILFAAVGTAAIGRHLSTGLAYTIVLVGLCFGLLQVLSGSTPHDHRYFASLADIEQQWTGFSGGTIIPTAWCNANLNSTDKLLLIGDAQAYHYRVPIEYATCFNKTPGQAWLEDLPSALQRSNLKEHGVTHLLIDWLEIERYRRPGNYGFGSWPTHDDIDQMVADGILRRVNSPLDPKIVEILEVL